MDFLDSPAEFARVLGILVPVVVAIVTKKFAPSPFKTWVNVALTALAGVAGTVVGLDGGWDWGSFFNAWFNALLAAVAAYYGVLKPTGIADNVIDATARFGVGREVPPAQRRAA